MMMGRGQYFNGDFLGSGIHIFLRSQALHMAAGHGYRGRIVAGAVVCFARLAI